MDCLNWWSMARLVCRIRSMACGVHPLLALAKQGVWQWVVNALASETEIEQVLIDSTIVGAHQHPAGAEKRTDRRRSVVPAGELSTKLHLANASTDRPLRLIVTEGQVADISCATQRIGRLRSEAVIADKGYHSDAFEEKVRTTPAKVAFPRSNRKTAR